MDERIGQTVTVDGAAYRILRLLGKGKGGYSYLVTDGAGEYVLKQIHHEPCEYYQFGDKLAAELNDYRRLREAGVRTQLYTEQKKFKQKMSYADKLGVPYILLLGEDEITQGKVSLKDMATGEQTLTDADQAAARILAGGRAHQGTQGGLKKTSFHGKKICNKTASHALVR